MLSQSSGDVVKGAVLFSLGLYTQYSTRHPHECTLYKFLECIRPCFKLLADVDHVKTPQN